MDELKQWQSRSIAKRGELPTGVVPTLKVVDDHENPIYDPSQGKLVPWHKTITIDGLTGRELTPEDLESPMDRVQRLNAEAAAKFQQEMASAISVAKATGAYQQPWLANTPKAGVVRKMLTEERKVLSEFVKGNVETAVVTHEPNVTQIMHVGHQGVEKPDVPLALGMPAANSIDAMYGSMQAAIAANTCGAPSNGIPSSTIVTDIPGYLYAQLADDAVEAMKAQGHRYAFLDMDVPSNSTTFAEFKAIMKDKGYQVNTNEMVWKSSGPCYKVLLTW